tara:strand:+ start:2526 stop:3092 length:567 start_codon:yes stop_codon:yes gene_type:complete
MSFSYDLIGICGFARTGKDSLARFFESLLSTSNQRCKITSFAYYLKKDIDDFLQSRLNISAFTEDPIEKEIIRPLLVCWGTEIIRNKIDTDYWIRKMHNVRVVHRSQGITTIIPDVRFANEVEWIHSLGGTTIYIEREGVGPINSDEEKHTKKLKKMCKFSFYWDNLKDFENTGHTLVKDFLNDKQPI